MFDHLRSIQPYVLVYLTTTLVNTFMILFRVLVVVFDVLVFVHEISTCVRQLQL